MCFKSIMNLSLESLQLSENDSPDQSPDRARVFKDFELIKIFDYHVKIITELDKTLLIWETYPTRDLDTHELAKAELRASEFRARFTRNYLYPLQTETRAITNLKTSPDKLLKMLTRAYQTAFTALSAFNAYSIIGGNLPVLDKIKDCANDIKILRGSSRDVLEPIEKTLGSDRDQLDVLCQKILDIPEIIYKEQKKPRNLVPKSVKSSLDMYEPKLTNWARKTRLLAKLRYRKKQPRDDVVPNSIENQTDLKPEIFKVSKKPVELDGDVETAIGAYSSVYETSQVKTALVLKTQREKPSNVGLFCVTSEKEEAVEVWEEAEKRERILKISPQILDELFRFKIQLSENENNVNEQVALISEVSDAIINDFIHEIGAEIMDENFLEQLIAQELTDMTHQL